MTFHNSVGQTGGARAEVYNWRQLTPRAPGWGDAPLRAASVVLPSDGEYSLMQEAAVSPLIAWENFYVITGSSAGALTGLTFVVITLTVGRRQRGVPWGVGAFTTPTIVHLGVVLFISMVLSAPWPALAQPSAVLTLCGLAGLAYAAIVVRRLRRRETYDPVLEDWLWYAAAPLAIYVALVVAALLLPGSPTPALFGIAAVMALLLFIGIRNAWDVATFITFDQSGSSDGQPDDDGQK